MENKIPTAEEFIKRDKSGVFNEVDISKLMIDFTKLHVERALKSAIKQAIVIEYVANPYTNETDFRVKEDSILNAYSLENIK